MSGRNPEMVFVNWEGAIYECERINSNNNTTSVFVTLSEDLNRDYYDRYRSDRRVMMFPERDWSTSRELLEYRMSEQSEVVEEDL